MAYSLTGVDYSRFFPFDNVKSIVHPTNRQSIREIREKVTEVRVNINPEILQNVKKEFVNKMIYYQGVIGNSLLLVK